MAMADDEESGLIGELSVVHWAWRLVGALLALSFLAGVLVSFEFRSLLFRYNTTQLLDNWQRLSPRHPDSGEVVVVGIDALAINNYGPWPWNRLDLKDLVEAIASAEPRSVSLDILLTEAGPYSPRGLSRVFRQNIGEVMALAPKDLPDDQLANALLLAPTVLGAKGGPVEDFDERRIRDGELFCSSRVADGEAAPEAERELGFLIECLLLPYESFRQTAGIGATQAEVDIDGVVRRTRAVVGLKGADPEAPERVDFYPAFSLAALWICGSVNPNCLTLPLSPEDLSSEGVNEWTNFALRPERAGGGAPVPEISVTTSLSVWMDFGAFKPEPAFEAACEEVGADRALCPNAPLYEIVSAADVMAGREAALARLKDKFVFVGLTRLGDTDQHTTPVSGTTGTPGVLIQALAADNMLTGRTLAQFGWTAVSGQVFMGLMALFALCRFFTRSIYLLAAVIAGCVFAPILISWAAFELGGTIVYGLGPALAALLAGAPIFFGRIAAIIQQWIRERDERQRKQAQLEVMKKMQKDILPFDVSFREAGVDSAQTCEASVEVGGDFFEKVSLPDGRIFGAVGDVMGKDTNAVLVMVTSRVVSGVVAQLYNQSLGAIFREISDQFLRCAPNAWLDELGGFTTLVAARLDPATGKAEFACAGADRPIVMSREGELREVPLPSTAPIGWLDAPTFETVEMVLNPGDSIVMFTDGVTEAPAPTDDEAPPEAGIEFGYDRAVDTVRSSAALDSPGIMRALQDAVTAHLAGDPPIDDTTILVMTYLGPDAA